MHACTNILLELSIRPDLISKLVPNHCVKDLEASLGIDSLQDYFVPVLATLDIR